jgi:hypothetical protein
MSNFLNNLFGSIAGQNLLLNNVPDGISFIPIDGAYNTLDIKGNNAAWLGLQNKLMQKYAYEFCYPLASVVDRLAEADLTGDLEILRFKGKGKEDEATSPYATRMKALLERPNPLQSWEQFRGQQVVYKRVYGFCPVLPVMPSGFGDDKSYAVAMINLPPWNFKAVPTGKYFGQSNIDGFVKEYTCEILNNKITLQPDQIFILTDGFTLDESEHYLLPKSRLVGLDMAVSNICAAMEADNVLLKKKGPLGIFSHDAAATKDSVAGYLPMTQKEKDEIQSSLTQYGLNLQQFQYIISRQAIKWNPISFNTKELGTKETVIAGEKAICHRYGYSYILYEDSGATFSNQNGAQKGLYQDNIIPNNSKDMGMYDKFFNAEENNCTIKMCYDDLPILQEDELEKAQAAKAWDDALLIEWNNDLITKNQWLTARGYDTIPDGDKYKSETAPAPIPGQPKLDANGKPIEVQEMPVPRQEMPMQEGEQKLPAAGGGTN